MSVKTKTNKTLNIKNIKDKIRLDKAYTNYCKIANKNLPYKFSYLDEWLLKKSKLLLNESENFLSKFITTHRVYKRGTLIKVDFGVNLGSEMSQVHFAIVLNNFDNPKNNILMVIPLTSKYSKFNTNLGNIINDKLLDKVNFELQKLDNKEETKLEKLNTLKSYYQSNVKTTYACCSLITTISKSRILPPINEYDIIGREKCSSEIMNKIDKEITDRFTQDFTSK